MLYVLLPTFAHGGHDPALRAWLVRGDRMADTPHGYMAALSSYFHWPSGPLPAGALLREAQHGDAGMDTWLCADPAYVQPDMTGARMLACGTLDLDADEADALARPLRPLFGDLGFLLETSTPGRWHVRLPRDAQPPAFASPDQVLGDDLLPHLPQGAAHGAWRNLFTETQVLLHQNPVNEARRARGKMPVNCLWLWGGGRLPAWVKADVGSLYSRDPLARVLGQLARIEIHAPGDFDPKHGADNELLDLESGFDAAVHAPLLAAALRRHAGLTLRFASGEGVYYANRHRWRVWRRIA